MKNQITFLKIHLLVLFTIVCCLPVFANLRLPIIKQLRPASITNVTICNNQLPYLWNNITCLIAGTYSATLTSSSGVDSIALLNLSVINVGISITNATICDNQLPYVWNGHTYTTGGTYSVTLTSSNGCDSVPILSLTINHFVTSTTSKTLCSNQLPYSWNGNSYTASGAYSVTLRSNAGCDSIASLVLTVKPVASSTRTVIVCSNQLPYVWNGRTYSTAGVYTLPLIASNGCDSVARLDLKVNPTSYTTVSVSVCANQLPYTWHSFVFNATGTAGFTTTNYLNCDSFTFFRLTVIPTKSSTTNIIICNGQLPYNWNGNSYPAAGTYAVTLTGSNGCDSIATLNLVTKAFLTSTTDYSVCISDLPYSWNGNSYSTGGTYTAPFVTTTGCDSIATLNLTVITPYFKSDSLLICAELLPYNYHGHIFTAEGNYAIVPPVIIDACHSVDSIHLVTHLIPPGTSIITRCANQLPYIWNGLPFSIPGQYSMTIASGAGCDSTANLDLSVNNVYTKDTTIKTCSNQTPFNWNGNMYDTSGTYVARLTSSGGCDSIVTLHLIVNSIKTSLTAISICNSQVPYSWNGNNYTTSGSYSVTLISSEGCDSVATLHLFVQSFLTSTTNITACDNQLPYLWNGNSYPAAGSFSVTLRSSGGCDSLATLNLSINNVITSTTNVNTCISQLPYMWNGNNYTVAGTYAVTLITSAGCDSVATLHLNIGSPVTSTTEITICNNQLPFTWNGNIFPVAGTYPVTLISSRGCDSVATLQLIVKAILTSTTNVNVCSTQLPYIWSGNSYTTGGTYSQTLTTVAGCDSVPILSLTIVPYMTSTTDLTICNNQLPYIWNGHTYTTAGTYAVLLTGTSVCDSLATLNLTVRSAFTSTTSISVCPLQLPYNWNGNNYTAGGTYSKTFINSAGCDSIATLNLIVLTIASSNTFIRICTDQLPYLWNGNSYTTGGTYLVKLNGSNGCDSIATLKLIVNPITNSHTQKTICITQLPYTWNGNNYSAAGTYSVMLSGSEACDSIATLQLLVNPVSRSSTVIKKCNNELPYHWNGHIYSSAGIYNDTLQNSNGCDSIATMLLVVNAVSASNTEVRICSTALPYNWNGNNYTLAGTYTQTLSNSIGCDSVATLHLLVNTISTSSTVVKKCNNELPYIWNGHSYSSAGIYNDTLQNSNSCDSIAILQLIVNPVTTSNTEVTICSTALPYNWNGNSYSSTGTYSLTLTNSNGCDSIVTLKLFVTAIIRTNTVVKKCNNELPYNWNGSSYTLAGIYSDTLQTSAGCDSIIIMQLIINPVTTSNTYIAICNTELPYTWNGQLYSLAGTYNRALINSNGCDSVATLQLIVNTVSTSVIIASICSNQLPYTWNGQQYQATGNYFAVLRNAVGCDSLAQLRLTVNPVATSNTTAATCSAQLPYTWNGQSFTSAGIYTLTLASVAGCDSVATLNLTVNPTPPAPATLPLMFCQYEQATLLTATTTSPGSHLVWYNAATGGTGLLTAPIISTSVPSITNYYVSQATEFCEGPRAVITVTINSKPVLGPDKDIKLCFADSLNLALQYNTTGLAANWTFEQQTVTNNIIKIGGIYQLVVKNNEGCMDTSLVNLTILPEPFANAGPDDDAEYNAPYQLDGNGNATFEWSPADNLSNPFIANPTATLTADETFTLTVKNELGCFAVDTVKLRVLRGPTFYVPSAFTPNGDGYNDIFRPTPVGIASLEYFRVFNRYGEMVYETNIIHEGWNGIYKGAKQNIGNYVWMLKGTDRFGKVRLMKGNVVLVR